LGVNNDVRVIRWKRKFLTSSSPKVGEKRKGKVDGSNLETCQLGKAKETRDENSRG